MKEKLKAKLLENWKDILTRAWSIRFMLLAGILQGAAFVASIVAATRVTFWTLLAAFVLISAAFVARLIKQGNLPDE